MAEKTIIRHVKIAGQPFVLRYSDVLRAVRNVDPEPITSHFVVVGARRFPPKQVLSEVTGLDRADFTTHQASPTILVGGHILRCGQVRSDPPNHRPATPLHGVRCCPVRAGSFDVRLASSNRGAGQSRPTSYSQCPSRAVHAGRKLAVRLDSRPRRDCDCRGEICLVAALKNMSDPQTSPIGRETLDEFIRQLFVCNWVLGEMIAHMLDGARSEQHDAGQEPITTRAYSMIRSAIGEVVDRHGAPQIEAATKLIDEVMEAISEDSRVFPADRAVTRLFPDRHPRRRPVRKSRR